MPFMNLKVRSGQYYQHDQSNHELSRLTYATGVHPFPPLTSDFYALVKENKEKGCGLATGANMYTKTLACFVT